MISDETAKYVLSPFDGFMLPPPSDIVHQDLNGYTFACRPPVDLQPERG